MSRLPSPSPLERSGHEAQSPADGPKQVSFATVATVAFVTLGLIAVAVFWEPIFFRDSKRSYLEVSVPDFSESNGKFGTPGSLEALVEGSVGSMGKPDTLFSPVWHVENAIDVLDDVPVSLFAIDPELSQLLKLPVLHDDTLYTTDGRNETVTLDLRSDFTEPSQSSTKAQSNYLPIRRSNALREKHVPQFATGTGHQVAFVSENTFQKIAALKFGLEPTEVESRYLSGLATHQLRVHKHIAWFSDSRDLRSVKRDLKAQGLEVTSF